MVVHLQMISHSTGDLKITDEENTRETNQNSTLPHLHDITSCPRLTEFTPAAEKTQIQNQSTEIPREVIQSYGVGIMPQSFRCPRQHPPNFLHTRLPYPPPFFGGQCGGQWSNVCDMPPRCRSACSQRNPETCWERCAICCIACFLCSCCCQRYDY
ncbi:unnamed protein product [Plutella xylostella]|uniref:(diamondback moth) hypothetical protein n=1 Tax=Plutella xylostella TaxID=51655 RepID=A0A8S4E0I6_PLUXY|nr:unnamed protein product [Plutella xylostella]